MRTLLVASLALAGAALPVLAADAPAAAPLSVRITAPRGGQTSDRVVAVRGTVTGCDGDRLTLVVNGIPMSVALRGTEFEQPQVLAPGLNTIRAVAVGGGQVRQDEVAVYASVPAKDLRITMTWDTAGTDVDLWVTGPDGVKVFYGARQGPAGGTLDTDVTTGFGPETYTQARLSRGTYRVQAHAFRIELPTRVVVTTVEREGTPDEERRVFEAVLLGTGDVAEVGEFTAN